jgi:hypothetical protein
MATLGQQQGSGSVLGWANEAATGKNYANPNLGAATFPSSYSTASYLSADGTPVNTSGGGAVYSGPTQAQIYAQQQAAAQRAQEAADNAKRAELRGGIRNSDWFYKSGVYDLLHGDINSAAAEQRQGFTGQVQQRNWFIN